MEDFAETGMVGVYDKVVPGGFGGINSNWNQIFHQYATYQGYLGDTILPGGTCNKRFPNTAPVQKGARKMSAQDADERPDTEFKSDNITLIVPKKEVEGQVAYTWL